MSSASNPSEPGTTGLGFSLRLSLFYAVFFVIGYVGVITAADYLVRQSIASNERALVSERLAEYRAWYRSGQARELQERFREQARRSRELEFVFITGPTIDVLLFSSPQGSELLDPAELRRFSSPNDVLVATLQTPEPRNVWTIASTPLGDGNRMQAGRISTQAFAPADRFRRGAWWALIPVSLLALGGGAFLNYRAMKPVRDLTRTVSRIVETGELDRRVPLNGRSGDLAEMGVMFNRMLDQNQALIRAMRDSLDNTAHDLRTPMARMRATAESALTQPGNEKGAREALADCVEESDRVLLMLNTLMDIAEAETGVMQLHRETVNLPAIAAQVCDLYELVAEEKRVTIESVLPDVLEIEADGIRLQQAIANLIDNALKYGRPEGKIRLEVASDGEDAILTVADDGEGIDPDDLPRIWDRLYRGDRSRSERGLGLGLSFVKAIVDAHGGTVSVDSRPGEGARFVLRLPRKATSSAA